MDKLNANNDELELRILEVSQRAEGDESNPVIEGEAAVFNKETVIMGWFREMIAPGAFARVLSEKQDVVAALNHNWDIILGRTTSGTLDLKETRTGLHYEINVNPQDTEAMNTWQKVKRGDVTQASFAFTVRKEEWVMPDDDDSNELPLRIIKEVNRLYDVGPCTFGAFPQASASARSKAAEFKTPAPGQEPGAGDAEGERQESLDLLQRRLDLASK